MRAVTHDTFGDPVEVLRQSDRPIPQPGPRLAAENISLALTVVVALMGVAAIVLMWLPASTEWFRRIRAAKARAW